MTYALNPHDPFELPNWLRVTPAEAKRRAAEWERNPPRAMPAFQKPRESNPDIEAFAAAEAARQEMRTKNRNAARTGGKDLVAQFMPAARRKAADARLASLKRFIAAVRATAKQREVEPPELAAICVAWQDGKEIQVGTTRARKGKPARPPVAPPTAHDKQVAASRSLIEAQRKNKPLTPTMQTITTMLERSEGATLDELAAATGTFRHSCSASLSGIRKTRTIDKAEVAGRGTVYRLKNSLA